MFTFLSCDPNVYGTLEDHFNVDADQVSKMTITKNDTEIVISDIKIIHEFFSILDGCSANIEIEKQKVYERYEVRVIIGSKTYIYNFKDKNSEGLILGIKSKGHYGHWIHYSKCHEMETLLKRIFRN
jgi:hypothetical protein